MPRSTSRLALLSFLLLPVLATAASGPHPVSASPELLRRLGPAAVRALAGDGAPERELYALSRAERAKRGPAKVAGTGSCLVILMDWTDHPADTANHPQSAYDQMMFSTGSYPTGSLNDFYLENSYGQYGVSGLVSGWHTSALHVYADYTPTDYSSVRQMVQDAIQELDPVIDYSQYDNDGPDGVPNSGDDDGYVDALFFVHAGPGREQTGDPNDIWSHAWAFYGGLATADGVSVGRYSVEPEMLADGSLITVGVFCHEYGHVLGLPDLYDTDYSSSGIGEWGLMSGGSWSHRAGDPLGSSPAHMVAWSKIQLGWLTPVAVTADMVGVTIPPVETTPTVYRIFRGGAASGDEYFLLENRQPLGFDASLVRRQVELGLPQPAGLLITHVDDSISGNSNERRRLVDVVEASPWFDGQGGWFEHLDGEYSYGLRARLDHNNRGDNGDVWPGFSQVNGDTTDWVAPRDRNRFADDTIPPAEDNQCDRTGIAVENITLAGQDVTADLLVSGLKRAPVVAADKSLSWTFETGTDGWSFCRSYVHRDATQAGSCGGPWGLWFGADDSTWACPPGYGNNWNDFTWTTVGVSAGASITLRHRYELEQGYDFAVVEVRCAGDPDAAWTEVARLSGTSSCVTDTWPVPLSAITACQNAYGYAALDLRLRLESDGGWSAEDGNFCGIGWWVDEVSVNGAYAVAAPDVPAAPELAAPEPNPFNPAVTLRFSLPREGLSPRLEIFDQRGQRVRTLPVADRAGEQAVRWDGRDAAGRALPSGVYFARFSAGEHVQVEKLALVR